MQTRLISSSVPTSMEDDFLAYIKKLEETKPVIFCGDLNVAH